MQKIKNLIQNNNLDDAMIIINTEILNQKNYGAEIYHELFFAKGIINLIRYENERPHNNKLYIEAKEDFAHAENAYLLLHNKQCSKYKDANIYSDRVFTNFNTKRI